MIKELHAKMRELIIKSKIEAEAYDALIANIDDKSQEYKDLILQKLQLVYKDWQYANIIWRLCPPSMWAMYEEFGDQSLREQKILKTRLKLLRKSCIENLSKKATKCPVKSRVQPDQTGTVEGNS